MNKDKDIDKNGAHSAKSIERAKGIDKAKSLNRIKVKDSKATMQAASMENLKKKALLVRTPHQKKVRRLLVAIGIMAGILVLFYVYRFFWSPKPIVETPVVQAVTGLVTKEDETDVIDTVTVVREHEKNIKPFPLLAAKPDVPPLVSPSAINLLIMARDVEANLYDTLMIVSMNLDTGVVSLINIPRDLYVDYSVEALKLLNKKISGMNGNAALRKINAAHKLGKLIKYREDQSRFGQPDYDFTADLVEEMFSLSIDDFVFVHHDSFKQIVDQFGGVTIDVPYAMRYDDPVQNLHINLKAGLQRLKGEDAEGFVRFRKGYNANGKWFEIGDLGRKENQNLFVREFMDQHLNLGEMGELISLANRYTDFVDTSVVGKDKIANFAQIGKKLIKLHYVVNPIILETGFQRIYGSSHLVLGKGVKNPGKVVVKKEAATKPKGDATDANGSGADGIVKTTTGSAIDTDKNLTVPEPVEPADPADPADPAASTPAEPVDPANPDGTSPDPATVINTPDTVVPAL